MHQHRQFCSRLARAARHFALALLAALPLRVLPHVGCHAASRTHSADAAAATDSIEDVFTAVAGACAQSVAYRRSRKLERLYHFP